MGREGLGKRLDKTVPRMPIVLCPLFSVCALITINVPLTLLGSCLMMDCLFQITFDRLFVLDNIYFIKRFKIIFFRCMHKYLLCNKIFVSDTDEFKSNYDLL